MKQADKEVHNYFLSFLPRQLTTASIQRKAQAAVILQAAGRKADAQAFEASIKEHLVQARNTSCRKRQWAPTSPSTTAIIAGA